MTEHLSQQQIEELLIDGADQRARDHLISCASCRSKWGCLDEMLQLYRSTATFTASSVIASRPIFMAQQSSPRGKLSGLKWIVAGAVLIGLSLPIFEQHREQQRHAAEIAKDNLLLEQVDRAVSEPVPQPLESLRYLVVAENTKTTTLNSKQGFNETR